MPKDLSALDAQKDGVIQWLNEGLTYEDVRRRLASQGVYVSERTLTSRIKRWGISRYNKRHRLDATLQSRVAYYFHECQLTDEETVERLAADGWKVTKWTVGRMRRQQGLLKRVPAEAWQGEPAPQLEQLLLKIV